MSCIHGSSESEFKAGGLAVGTASAFERGGRVGRRKGNLLGEGSPLTTPSTSASSLKTRWRGRKGSGNVERQIGFFSFTVFRAHPRGSGSASGGGAFGYMSSLARRISQRKTRLCNAGNLGIVKANVIIQISSHIDSPHQEAQRLDCILRAEELPQEKDYPSFYSLVSMETQEAADSTVRQHFFVDQGYTFEEITSLSFIDLNCNLSYDEQIELLNQVLYAEDDMVVMEQEG
ncbi:general transcription and DNA repair factor IIH helicase subunit XPB-like isoform X2 [Zingiber officinale]|uniref:general transcription and DNA repair factor IIH helicase subunit XPB-like isoform X2 n=1 Tax=Zingiber officinale TaxID=94328 RepID=UPI001C4D5C16|nr:general transcription and DNA repair factor IIH helicase subunit XPB-like isoform X2 [Zingiber officinale]